MKDLELIRKQDVANSKGVPYSEFRRTLTPRFLVVWRDILIGYSLLVSTVAAYIYVEFTWDLTLISLVALSIPFAFIAAFWLSFIQLFLHEAAHYNIHPNKVTNDLLANIFISTILGLNIHGYRKTHWKHHLRLGYSDDTENSYFNPLNRMNLVRMLTGLHAVYILKNRNKKENAQDDQSLLGQRISLLIGGLVNLLLLAVLFVNSLYMSCVTWCLTVIVFYPFFATIRQILEHRDDDYTGENKSFHRLDHGKVSRLFKDGILSFFLGGAGFSRHMLHHWDPSISYTRLYDLEEYLLDSPQCRHILETSRTTYWRTLLRLIEK